MDHVIVRYTGRADTLIWKLSRKDSLFIPQTFTERMVLPSATEQMAQGNRYTRPPPSWRIPDSPQNDKSVAATCTHLLWSGAQIFSLPLQHGEADHYQFFFLSTGAEEWIMPNWHKQFQLPSEFGLKPNYIFLVCATAHEKYNLSLFLSFKNIQKLKKRKPWLSKINQACSSRIILSTIHSYVIMIYPLRQIQLKESGYII